MEADARTLLTFIGPLAVAYMTYSSVSAELASGKPTDLKTVSFSQIGAAPKLPSAEQKLRNPFVPARGTGAAAPLADAEGSTDPEKNNDPLRLDGTAMMGKIRFAIVNGVRVTEGDYFRGMRLTKVEATQVTLTSAEGVDQTLPLAIAKSDSIRAADREARGEDGGTVARVGAAVRKGVEAIKGGGGGTGRPLPAQAAKAGARR